jgi:hypothetical protein
MTDATILTGEVQALARLDLEELRDIWRGRYARELSRYSGALQTGCAESKIPLTEWRCEWDSNPRYGFP